MEPASSGYEPAPSGYEPAQRGADLPLLRAAANGCGDVVQVLLNHSCRSDIVDDQGRNLLQLAENSGKEWVIELIRGTFPAMVATKEKGRVGDERSRGQLRQDVDLAMQHPNKGKKGQAKRL